MKRKDRIPWHWEQRFAKVSHLSADSLMNDSVQRIKLFHEESGYRRACSRPPIPVGGANEDELTSLETSLGIRLPSEYRSFLHQWRYLDIYDLHRIWGISEGGYPGESVELQHFDDDFIVIGGCPVGADSDTLMLRLGEQPEPAYLAIWGDKLQRFAPSFSLALWRIAEELLNASSRAALIDGVRRMGE